MGDVDGYAFEQLSVDTLAAIVPTSIARVVVDLRRNGGGDNYAGEALRHDLARSRFNRPGGLYVLTSPQTFSAAQNFANRLEREMFASVRLLDDHLPSTLSVDPPRTPRHPSEYDQ